MISLGSVIAIVGGWSIIIVGAISYISNILLARYSIKWQNDFNIKLEQFKSENTRNHTLLTSVISNYSSGFSIIQKERIKAIQYLWEMVINLRKYTNPQIFIYGIVTELSNHELRNTTHLKKINNSFQKYDINELLDIPKKVENFRPFIGEDLWTLFLAYYSFINYSSIILNKSIEENNIKPWQEDDGLKEVIKITFNKEESELLLSKRMYSFGEAIRALEFKVINKIYKIFNGEEDLNISIENINKINKLLNKNDDYELEKIDQY